MRGGSSDLSKRRKLVAGGEFGLNASRWTAMRTHQAIRWRTMRARITMRDPAQLKALIEAEKPMLVVPEIEAIATRPLMQALARNVQSRSQVATSRRASKRPSLEAWSGRMPAFVPRSKNACRPLCPVSTRSPTSLLRSAGSEFAAPGRGASATPFVHHSSSPGRGGSPPERCISSSNAAKSARAVRCEK